MTNSKRSTSSRADSPANLFRLRVGGKLKPIRVGSGRSSYASCLRYDPDSSSWRTYPDSSIEGWPTSSVIFPRAGTMRNGIACRQQPLALRTSENESSLWPTPISGDWKGQIRADGTAGMLSGKVAQGWEPQKWPTPKGSPEKFGRHRPNDRGDLQAAVTRWPTPTSRDHKDGSAGSCKNVPVNNLLGRAVHQGRTTGIGQLNPTWVEWLMGFPLGWTDLEDSATPSSHKSRSG